MSSFGSRTVRCAAVLTILLVAALGLVHAQSAGADLKVGPHIREVAYLKASNAEAYDHFACGGGNQGHSGNSIALSGDGTTMAVGAPYESGGSRGINPPSPGRVAVRPDGPVLAGRSASADRPGGASGGQEDDSLRQAGAVYVYTRSAATWTARAYVKGSNTEAGDEFGSAVALSGDGRTLVVGAHNEDGVDNSADDSGAVYVFMY